MTEIFQGTYHSPIPGDVQISSSLLLEENRDKWQKAQLMGPDTEELFWLVKDFMDVIGFCMKDLRDTYQSHRHQLLHEGWWTTGDWANVPEDRVTVSKSIFSMGLADCIRRGGGCDHRAGASFRGHALPSPEQGPDLGVGQEEGHWQCSLLEADDSSVLAVGTKPYRNLGSFPALQRWARRARGVGEGQAMGGHLHDREAPAPLLFTPLEIEFTHMDSMSALRTHVCVHVSPLPDPTCATPSTLGSYSAEIILCQPADQRPRFLVTAPGIIRPGGNVTVGVELLEHSPAQVTVKAELVKMAANLTISVLEAEGVFEKVTLRSAVCFPRLLYSSVDQSIHHKLPLSSADEIYELRVTGRAQDEILFANSTRLSFETKRTTVFIQTDKPLYKPKQEVKFRIVTLFADFKPYKTSLNILIKDPKSNLVQQWLSEQSDLGVVSKTFQLSSHPVLGDWSIQVQVNCFLGHILKAELGPLSQHMSLEHLHEDEEHAGLLDQTYYQSFQVSEYVLPKFEVALEIPLYCSLNAKSLNGTITAKPEKVLPWDPVDLTTLPGALCSPFGEVLAFPSQGRASFLDSVDSIAVHGMFKAPSKTYIQLKTRDENIKVKHHPAARKKRKTHSLPMRRDCKLGYQEDVTEGTVRTPCPLTSTPLTARPFPWGHKDTSNQKERAGRSVISAMKLGKNRPHKEEPRRQGIEGLTDGPGKRGRVGQWPVALVPLEQEAQEGAR
ncbi:hypothetical protein CB1_001259001 [Camelus ferus]|nr:hypothetical protein CB1_001259001 [Camelus ferus]